MEAGSSPQGEPRKRYLTTFTFAHGEALDIERAMDEAREVIGCAERQEMTLLDGQTHVAREREPIEQFTYGSERVFKNERALAQERGEAWAQPSMTAPQEAVH